MFEVCVTGDTGGAAGGLAAAAMAAASILGLSLRHISHVGIIAAFWYVHPGI